MQQRQYSEQAPFDTLSYAKKLQSAGFSQEQAEVQAETFLSIVREQLVSKRDLKELEKELKVEIEKSRSESKVGIEKVHLEIEQVRADLKIEIEKVHLDIERVHSDLKVDIKSLESKTQTLIELLRRDLKIWFGSMLVVVVGVLTAVTTLLPHAPH